MIPSPDNLGARGGVCLCGAVGRWSIQFGGCKPAHFLCGKCGRKYDLQGEPINAT